MVTERDVCSCGQPSSPVITVTTTGGTANGQMHRGAAQDSWVMVHTKLYISLGYDYINVVYIGDLSSCNT